MQLSHDWCLLVFAQRAPGLSLTIQYFICYFNSVALLITFTWFYIPLVYIPQLLKALIPLHPGNPAAGYSQLWAVWFSNVVDFEYKICSKGNKSKSVGLHFIIINSLHKECSAFSFLCLIHWIHALLAVVVGFSSSSYWLLQAFWFLPKWKYLWEAIVITLVLIL